MQARHDMCIMCVSCAYQQSSWFSFGSFFWREFFTFFWGVGGARLASWLAVWQAAAHRSALCAWMEPAAVVWARAALLEGTGVFHLARRSSFFSLCHVEQVLAYLFRGLVCYCLQCWSRVLPRVRLLCSFSSHNAPSTVRNFYFSL